jgi:hypothetical protein
VGHPRTYSLTGEDGQETNSYEIHNYNFVLSSGRFIVPIKFVI